MPVAMSPSFVFPTVESGPMTTEAMAAYTDPKTVAPLASPRAEANGEREWGAPRHERSLSESLESAQTSAWAREAGRGGSDKGRETSARQGLPPTVIGAPAHHARARSYSQADAHEPSLRTVLEEPRGANGGTTTEEE